MFCSQCIILGGALCQCNVISSDLNLHPLVKVVSAELLHCKLAIIPFVINKFNKYIIGRYFETANILLHVSLLPTNFGIQQ